MSSLRSLCSLNVLRSPRIVPKPTPAFQHIRHFHPTRPSQSIINDVLNESSAFIHGVHWITGLSWVYTIPLTAFIVRMTVALPSQIYSRIHARKERDLYPLLQSWRKYHQDQIKKENAGTSRPLSPIQAHRRLSREMKHVRYVLHRRWGVSRYWKAANFVQLPIWISLMESLRAMCGSNQGLIPFLLSLTRSGSGNVLPDPEPTLATEGAVWFPDLLAGDPTGILPAILTTSILLNIRMGWKATPLPEIAELPKTEMTKHIALRGLRLLVQFLALNVGISAFFQEMPCALMIYWISSTSVATVQTVLLEKYMSSTPPLKPWRPIYIGYLKPGQTRRVPKV